MRASPSSFLGANLLVAVFCAFALLALIHGPDGVSADCASGLCSHPCSVSQSACSNCYNIDAPAQCGGGGGGGGHKSTTVIINGHGNLVSTRQRRAEAQMAAAADALPSLLPSSLLRAKRDWKLDMKTEIQKNKAEVNTRGDGNTVDVHQS